MFNKDQVDLTITKLRPILEKASARIEAIPPGQKIPATKLAEDIAKEIGMTGPQLYPTLKFLLDDYPGVDVRAGAHGGIYKLLPGEVKGQKKATSPQYKPTVATVEKVEKSVDKPPTDGEDGAANNE